jgi:pyruvate formate lyase activating enzyme
MITDYIPMPKIPENEIISVIHPRVMFLDGVCVTGCEPLVHKELFSFLLRLKSLKTNVKLDTNGSYPKRLIALIARKYVDYVAMDVKVQPERYREIVNYKVTAKEIIESIQHIRRSGVDYEFKTTMVPGIVSEKDLKDIIILLAGSKRYTIQRFKPGNTLSKEYSDVKPDSEDEMKGFLDLAAPYFGEVRLV